VGFCTTYGWRLKVNAMPYVVGVRSNRMSFNGVEIPHSEFSNPHLGVPEKLKGEGGNVQSGRISVKK